MSEDDDWVMRPVLRGLCRYESIIECRIDLGDICRMNEALNVEEENRRIIAENTKAK